jgi:hypothetical protein
MKNRVAANPRFDTNAYATCQVDTRRSFGYGLYVIQGQAALQPVVTGFFLFSPMPVPSSWAALAALWRWTEIDWEFVPFTTSAQKEQVECSGTFPSAASTSYRSTGGAGPNPSAPVEGAWTDNLTAESIGELWNLNNPQHPLPDDLTWQQLVENTYVDDSCQSGAADRPCYGSDWGFPATLLLPDTDELQHAVAINVQRTPAGADTITSAGITASFVPQTPPNPPTGFNVTNEQFVWAQDDEGNFTFDPYNEFHTYSLVFTPESIAFYIDAPDGGTKIENAQPVKVFGAEDYASMVYENTPESVPSFGPFYPGGDQEWCYYGQNRPLGAMSIMLNIWASAGWGGVIPPDFQEASSYVKTVAFYPLASKAPGSARLTSQDFSFDMSDPETFHIDFTDASVWSASNWKYEFQKAFIAEYSNAPDGSLLKNPELVSWVSSGPDGNPALQLKLVPVANAPAQTFYTLSPGAADGSDPSTFMTATASMPIIENGLEVDVTLAVSSFPFSAAFWAPEGVTVTITASNPSTGKQQSCQIEIGPSLTWTPVGACSFLAAQGGKGDIGVGAF